MDEEGAVESSLPVLHAHVVDDDGGLQGRSCRCCLLEPLLIAAVILTAFDFGAQETDVPGMAPTSYS